MKAVLPILSLLFVACSAERFDIAFTDDGGAGDAGTDASKPKPPPPSDAGKADTGLDALAPCDGSCVATPPSGWTFVAYDPDHRDACPEAFETPTDLVEGLTAAAASCDCTCQVATAPTCDVGKTGWTVANNSTCSGGTSDSVANSDCTVNSFSTSASTTLYVTATAGTTMNVGSCAAPTLTTTITPSTIDKKGRSCLPSKDPTTCGDQKQCVPATTGTYGLCIETLGQVGCPTGYSQAHEVGTGVADTRDCSCGCSMTATCSAASVTMYSGSSACSGNETTFTADGECTSLGTTSVSWTGLVATSTASGAACSAVVNPTGQAVLENTKTICCAQ